MALYVVSLLAAIVLKPRISASAVVTAFRLQPSRAVSVRWRAGAIRSRSVRVPSSGQWPLLPSGQQRPRPSLSLSLEALTSSFSSSNNHDDGQDNNNKTPDNLSTAIHVRRQLLHDRLRHWSSSVHVEQLELAEQSNREDPTRGFHQAFGKPAIKTYRAFVYQYQQKEDSNNHQELALAADRVARQVEFLRKRHGAHTTDYIRHADDTTTRVSTRTFPLMLLLDNLRSALNVGSLFRTADACGCTAVLTAGITAHPHGSGAEKVAKSALGAERVVATQHFATTDQAMEHVRATYPEYTIVGLETTQHSQRYTDVDYRTYYNNNSDKQKRHGIVLVLGNEVTGIDPELLPQLDLLVELPMFGTKNSLSVAAVAPVVLFEILRQWEAVVNP